jgi:hypothetical protein
MQVRPSRARTALRRQRFVPAHYDPNYNPFTIPDDHDVLTLRDEEIERARQQKEFDYQKLLIERDCPTLPPVPRKGRPLTAPLAPRLSSTTGLEDPENIKIKPVSPEYQCREPLQEFIDQKRQIFLCQLLADRKNREIARIDGVQSTEENYIINRRIDHSDLENQYKMNRSQAEANLIRARKTMDAAIKRRCELSEELKKKRAQLDLMEYDISMDEESIESFRRFGQFMKKFETKVPPDRLYSDTSIILDEIDALENENLALMEKCGDMISETHRNVERIQGRIDETTNERMDMIQQTEMIPSVPLMDTRAQIIARETEVIDAEISRLFRIVQGYYLECFKKSADIGALTMLEKMENELEKMYSHASKLSPQYLAEKQNAIAKSRREKQRREKQEAQEREQQRKMKAALERSTKPVKKRQGRPVLERMVPIKVSRHGVDRREQEEQITEALLFGPIYE